MTTIEIIRSLAPQTFEFAGRSILSSGLIMVSWRCMKCVLASDLVFTQWMVQYLRR